MTTSLLGPHVIRPTPEAVDWARVAPVVKALDDTTAIRAAQRASVRVYRRYFAQQDIERDAGDVLDEVLRALGDAPATHVEVFNECFQRLGQGLEDYVDFTSEAVRALRARRPDLTLVGFCFSTGNPDQADWEYLRDRRYGNVSVIGLHEYWGRQGFTPWHALRHRTAHAWTQGDHPPFLITEAGRDRVEGGQGGWIADGLSEEAYLTELRAYEAACLTDPYVLAVTPFTGGPTPDWRAFTTDPIAGRLAATAGTLPTPPQEPTVPDVPLSVPVRVSHAADGNYEPGPRARTMGVVIHTTRGGASTVENEYVGTINWFQNPAAQVSAHAIVGAGSFSEVCRSVHDDEIAYHAREDNRTHLGLEIAQPNPSSPISDFQYRAAAELCRKWAAKYGFPLVRVMTQTQPGLIGHEDSEAGKRDGKTDPGPAFDWPRFLALVGGNPVPLPDTAPTLRDQTYALAEQLQALGPRWQAIGYPQAAEYVRTQGEAIKRTMVIQKGEH